MQNMSENQGGDCNMLERTEFFLIQCPVSVKARTREVYQTSQRADSPASPRRLAGCSVCPFPGAVQGRVTNFGFKVGGAKYSSTIQERLTACMSTGAYSSVPSCFLPTSGLYGLVRFSNLGGGLRVVR
jgi:hypothetical protein